MVATARLVVVVTSDPDRVLPQATPAAPFVIEAHPWITAHGELTADMLVERLMAADPWALCLAADVPEGLVLDICRQVDEQHPDVGVLLLRQPTSDLWREAARSGVRDIIAPSAEDTDLLPAIAAALERAERMRAVQVVAPDPPVRRGKVIVVLSPKGGSGKTMVASNIAVALATTSTGDTALVDLDCVFGDVASVLGIVPERTVGQLAMLPSFDSTTLKVFLSRHERSGLYVLAGSGLPEEGDAVNEKLSAQIIDVLSRDFAYVVIDTAAGLDERALAAIEKASDVVLVATMDVTSVRNLAKEINALDRLDLVGAHRHFILNRADARVGLEVGDVESVIGMTVDAALPSSRLVPLSMNRGNVIVIDEPESGVAKQLLEFADRFLPAPEAAVASGPLQKSRFSLRRR